MEDVENQIRAARSKVSSTISALESAIATYDGMKTKPENYADTIESMRRLHARLEAWAKKSLKEQNAPPEAKKKSISQLISIADSSKGEF